MLSKFLEQLGGKLAEQWAATILTPAFLFWLGGGGAWIWRYGWKSSESWIVGMSTILKVALVVGGLAGLMLSALGAQKVASRVLRILEGYWRPQMEWLRRRMVRRQNRRAAALGRRFQELEDKRRAEGLSFLEECEHTDLDRNLRRTPSAADGKMATRLGNTLRASEQWSVNKYGLDAAVCLPRLWLLLPAEAKKDLTEVRAGLEAGAVAWFWSVIFLVWTIWAWWAMPLALLAAFLAYRWILSAGEVYGDLLESAFDVHRMKLYEALRWPVPANAAAELQAGQRLTEYLWRGSNDPSTSFTQPK